ncbi:MAG: methyltransferase domain-containing protein [Streptosporangiales bacterium]|nr:methyltransferase domain-containing protein [Streptosporangiales bacterium]
MDRQMISAIAHQDHPIAAPLSDESVRRVLGQALPTGPGRLLDLGCGRGEWLVRALTGRPELYADGVDTDGGALAEAAAAAAEAGVADRLELHAGDAAEFAGGDPYDLVLSVGATHAFGGLGPTLAAARRHLAPGGAVLVGDGFWEREPGPATLDAGFEPGEYTALATTVDRVVADGWAPVYGHVSTLEEWDEYEWCWTGTLTRWAADNPGDPGAADAVKAAEEHRRAWLHGYRGTLGFLTLVLRAT